MSCEESTMYALQAPVTHGNIAFCIAFVALNFHFFGGQVTSTQFSAAFCFFAFLFLVKP